MPIVFPRFAKQEVTINGQHFPSETTLVPCIYLLHHREDLYPEPKQFKPERFLQRQCLDERSLAPQSVSSDRRKTTGTHSRPRNAGSHRYSPWEFMPFGGGNNID